VLKASKSAKVVGYVPAPEQQQQQQQQQLRASKSMPVLRHDSSIHPIEDSSSSSSSGSGSGSSAGLTGEGSRCSTPADDIADLPAAVAMADSGSIIDSTAAT
jgi:hypothetical protein